MKCTRCSQDSKRRERVERQCPRCGHAFAFEPQSGDPLTDQAFLSAIERVSAGGTVRWTVQHLYYEIARRLQHRGRGARRALIGFSAVSLLLAPLVSWWFGFAFAGFGLAAIAARPGKLIRLSRAEFDRMMQRWRSAHGNPKGLIVRRTTPSGGRALPPDIHHYSFDRAVISDRSETVDLLLANNFHFENNCAVLSADGYPEEAFDMVRAMLRQNPHLAVYVLHDATPDGCRLATRLERERWFHENARIVDVGLRPAHAKPFMGLWRASTAPVVPGSELHESEVEWLERYSLELAVIRPEQTIKRLFRAMSGHTDASSDGGGGGGTGGVWVDSGSFASDAAECDGGGDSFG